MPTGDPSVNRLAEIAELADIVAEEHCPIGTIDPSHIAATKGITTSFGQYADSFDGILEHRGGRFHIYCNLDRVGDRNSPRARFTLCHELGHFFIDDHRRALAAGLDTSGLNVDPPPPSRRRPDYRCRLQREGSTRDQQLQSSQL